MIKRILFFISVFSWCFSRIIAQTTYLPLVQSQNNGNIIEKVRLTNDETIITIKFPVEKKARSIYISSATVLVPSDEWSINNARQSKLDYPNFAPTPNIALLYADCIKRIREGREWLSKEGYLIRNLGVNKLDTRYKITAKERDCYYFDLHFDRLPLGCENVYVRELVDNGFEWVGIHINNPYPMVPHVGMDEVQLKHRIDSLNDGVTGIYEGFSEDKYKLACIKEGNEYKLIYMDSQKALKHWRLGEVKATLTKSSTPGYFKVSWYNDNKTINSDVYAMFEGGSMKIIMNEKEYAYLKMYPTYDNIDNFSTIEEWSGTGFALSNGYIVTNYHVIENAKTIYIQGVNGKFNHKYNAVVAVTDEYNDLALLKISDKSFNGFGQIPYNLKTSVSDVGEEIFVLGYPLTSTMGDEIKLTTGVISSKTGFQGDVSLYQISAPIQPGNSGGPLFDSKGSVIGIVNAKHKGAENVGYAIKSSYIKK